MKILLDKHIAFESKSKSTSSNYFILNNGVKVRVSDHTQRKTQRWHLDNVINIYLDDTKETIIQKLKNGGILV